jgi:hypothetical protein
MVMQVLISMSACGWRKGDESERRNQFSWSDQPEPFKPSRSSVGPALSGYIPLSLYIVFVKSHTYLTLHVDVETSSPLHFSFSDPITKKKKTKAINILRF